MKKMNVWLVMALIALGFSFSSCEKNEEDGYFSDSQISSVQDDAQSNDLMDDIDNETDDVSNANNSLKSASADTSALSGRTVVWTTNNDGTKTAVVTYTNFQNPHAINERVKNGKINIVITGRRGDNTYKRVVTFENFTVNGIKIEGTRTIEKVSDLSYRITLTGGKITFRDNTTFVCQYVRVRTMISGWNTPSFIWDDSYTFEGDAQGTTRKNVEYTKEIIEPVTILTAYRFPVSGSFKVTTATDTLTLDYGNGTLDAIATISKNGVSRTISLR
jgi:hypothetical protein